jgi:aryl-alcohol dehydrogenase-like predicted oxidoreductase
MKYRTPGRTDLQVSALCLGTMQFGWSADEATAFTIMDAFAEAGGTFIDTADIYSFWVDGNPGGVSETIIGNWMQQRKNRQDIILATKARGRMWDGPDGEGLSRAHLTRALDDSLRRLQTDYIDLYQMHWDDETVPMEETLGTLHEFVQAGKVRFIGCSNFSPQRLRESLAVSEQGNLVRYETLQPHYNLVHRKEYEAELRQICAEHSLGVIPYSPLEGGFLTGKYRRNAPHPQSTRAESLKKRHFNERGWAVIDALDSVAQKYERPIVHVALAWLFAQPTITAPIIGANSIEQLQTVLGAVDLDLDEDSIAILTEVSEEQ